MHSKNSPQRPEKAPEGDKTYLFESAPIGTAVITLAVPTIISSLVTVLYNLADTYFRTPASRWPRRSCWPSTR